MASTTPFYKAQGRATARGFTLLELLVVLAILAVLTMVAVQSLGPVEEKARFEMTQKTFANLRNAIVTNDQSAIGGFIADTGRPPTSVLELTGVPNGSGVAQPPADLPSHEVLAFIDGPDWNGADWSLTTGVTQPNFTLARGWQGPYVLPPAGANDIKDGWGHSLTGDALSLTTATTGITLRSPGNPTKPSPITDVLTPAKYAGAQIDGKIYSASNDAGPWCVAILAPGLESETEGVAIYAVEATATGGGANLPVATYSFMPTTLGLDGQALDARALLVGPRVLCALKGDDASADRVGTPQNIVVRPGSQTFDLYVP